MVKVNIFSDHLVDKVCLYTNVNTRIAQTSPDLATLEGSSCTDIMTCTGGCGYSF